MCPYLSLLFIIFLNALTNKHTPGVVKPAESYQVWMEQQHYFLRLVVFNVSTEPHCTHPCLFACRMVVVCVCVCWGGEFIHRLVLVVVVCHV